VKSTAVCIVDESGRIVKERALATEPESLADWLGRNSTYPINIPALLVIGNEPELPEPALPEVKLLQIQLVTLGIGFH